MMSSRKRKYITYRNNAGEGPSHGHRQHAQIIGKDRACGFGDILVDRQTDTHTHTDVLIAILRNRSSENIYTGIKVEKNGEMCSRFDMQSHTGRM